MAKHNTFTILVAMSVAFGGFLFGYDTSNIGGVIAMPAWLAVFGYAVTEAESVNCGVAAPFYGIYYCLSSTNKAMITSFLSIGTILGALSAGYIADKIGRKSGIITAAVIFIIGSVIQTAAASVAPLVVGRVVSGLSVGLISCLIPMFQAEIAPKEIRGALVAFYQLSITLGILLAQVVDLGTQNYENSASYRIPIGLQIAWGLIVIGLCALIPESPRYYCMIGEPEKARASLARLRSSPLDSEIVNEEMSVIQGNYEYELSLGEATYAECFKGTMLKRTMAGIWIQMFQQLTGVNFIFYYGTSFFIQAGISKPYLITVATGLINCGMTLPGIYLVEKIGRRKLLIGGALWMALCNAIIGITAVASPNAASSKNVLVAFTLLFIGGFAASWGPGAWVVISEIFPLKLRGKGMSMSTASNWTWNWVIAFVVPYVTDPNEGNLGSKIAFVWMTTSTLGAIYTYFYIPETAGLSLEDLDEMFESKMPFRLTGDFKPSGAAIHGKIHAESVGEEKSAHSVEKKEEGLSV